MKIAINWQQLEDDSWSGFVGDTRVKLHDEYALKKSGIDNELQKLQIELNLLLAKELTTA